MLCCAPQVRFGHVQARGARLTLHPLAFQALNEKANASVGGVLTIDVMADGQTARLPRRVGLCGGGGGVGAERRIPEHKPPVVRSWLASFWACRGCFLVSLLA